MPLGESTGVPLDVRLAVVLLARDPDSVARCLQSLLPGMPADVPLLAGGNAAGRAELERLAGTHEIVWLAVDGAAVWNAAADATSRADLLLVDDASELGEHSIADLVAAAVEQPDAATLTALANSALFLSVPRRNLPWPLLPSTLTSRIAADRVRRESLRLRPRTPTALPHLTLVRRSAIDLAGRFDASLSPLDALADFCTGCTELGLQHVVADDVFVAHRGAASGGVPGEWPGVAAERRPAFGRAVTEVARDRHSALARSLLAVSVALEPLWVTVDARCLGPGMSGTIVHTTELLGALDERQDVRVRALVSPQLGGEAARALAGMASVELLEAAEGRVERSHVVHRPWQIEAKGEMELLDLYGERTVITNQDLIGYRNPAGFGSLEAWHGYRRATHDALDLAAMVLFFSRTAFEDALAEDLVTEERARVVPIGAVPESIVFEGEPRAPEGVAGLDAPFLLMLGNRFRHKNVSFAIDLIASLRSRERWHGSLVIAGAEVLDGSGSGDDARRLLAHPEVAPHVLTLGAVSEAEKAWLLGNAAAVVYPSTYEGFGLIPFEAARAGTPTLVAHVSALRETVASESALLVPWDADASAAHVAPVLGDAEVRARLVREIAAAGARFTWAATAEGVVAAYNDAIRLPAPTGAKAAGDLGYRALETASDREVGSPPSPANRSLLERARARVRQI